MDMCYDGALVMPSNSVVMDVEEMNYVEGGRLGYINNQTCIDICGAALAGGVVTAGSVSAVAGGLGAAAAAIAAAVPGAGWVAGGILGAYAGAFAGFVVTAAITGKGVGVYLGFPTGLSFNVE